jgi:hypothetical protein
LDNDEVQHVFTEYVETALQTKDMDEHAFATETMYQTRKEHKVEHNIPTIMTSSIEIQ